MYTAAGKRETFTGRLRPAGRSYSTSVYTYALESTQFLILYVFVTYLTLPFNFSYVRLPTAKASSPLGTNGTSKFRKTVNTISYVRLLPCETATALTDHPDIETIQQDRPRTIRNP